MCSGVSVCVCLCKCERERRRKTEREREKDRQSVINKYRKNTHTLIEIYMDCRVRDKEKTKRYKKIGEKDIKKEI